jgi:zona occludens toxin (predicted ATPase)
LPKNKQNTKDISLLIKETKPKTTKGHKHIYMFEICIISDKNITCIFRKKIEITYKSPRFHFEKNLVSNNFMFTLHNSKQSPQDTNGSFKVPFKKH